MFEKPNYNGRKALKRCTNPLINEWVPATAGDPGAVAVEVYEEAAGLLLGRVTHTFQVLIAEPKLGEDGNPVIDDKGNPVMESRTEKRTATVTGIAVHPSELLPQGDATGAHDFGPLASMEDEDVHTDPPGGDE